MTGSQGYHYLRVQRECRRTWGTFGLYGRNLVHDCPVIVGDNVYSPTWPELSSGLTGIRNPCMPVYFGLSGSLHPSSTLAVVSRYTSTPRERVVAPMPFSLSSQPQFERSPVSGQYSGHLGDGRLRTPGASGERAEDVNFSKEFKIFP